VRACRASSWCGSKEARTLTDALESDLTAATNINDRGRRERQVSAVMIGVDPHKGSHTAVAINDREIGRATVRVRATGMPAE
jgi:hypothetical protein